MRPNKHANLAGSALARFDKLRTREKSHPKQISSGDLDPARGRNGTAFSDAKDDQFVLANESMAGGFSIFELKEDWTGKPREDAPWWILEPDLLEQFRKMLKTYVLPTLDLRVSEDEDRFKMSRSMVERWTDFRIEVDYWILRGYYLLDASDKTILESFKILKLSGIPKVPKTVAALKKRRQRLVDRGNLMFPDDKDAITPIGSRTITTAGGEKTVTVLSLVESRPTRGRLAIWKSIREGADVFNKHVSNQ